MKFLYTFPRTCVLSALFCSFFFINCNQVQASHAMGADLTFTCLGGNQYEVTLQLYRDCFGISASASQLINISSATCGQNLSLTVTQQSFEEASPLCAAQIGNSTCNGGTLQGVEVYTYTGVITLPAQCNDWILSFRLGNRNAAITNVTTPGSAFMYVETLLNNLDVSCNNSPTFTTPPVPYICDGVPFNYNHGVTDAEGDSVSYSLIAPLDNAGVPLTYVGGFTAGQPMTTTGAFGFDPLTGQMTFTPNGTQNAVLAVEVREYRNGVLISRTIRDMQVVVISCTNNVPTTTGITGLTGGSQSGNVISTCEGNTVNFSITANDIDVADILSVTQTITTNLPGATVNVVGTNPATITVNWPVPPGSVSNYNFTVTFEDNACPIPGRQILGYLINLPSVTLSATDTVYCGGPPADLIDLEAGGSGSGSYTWSPSGALSCTNCPNPTATVSSPTTFSVTFTDGATGCTATNTVDVAEYDLTASVTPASPQYCPGDPAIQLTTDVFLNGNPYAGGVLPPPPATCTYTLNMFDSFGDGWNGAFITVLVNGSSIGTFTVATGSSDVGSFTVNDGDAISIVFSGGTFDSEITYNLTQGGSTLFSDGTFPFIGTAFTTTCSGGTGSGGSGCSYTLNMFDSFGDGWNGASINVLVNGSSVGTFTVPVGGSNAVGTFSANDGDAISIVFSGGTFDSEITYNLTQGGSTLFSDGPFPFIGTAFTTTCTAGGGGASDCNYTLNMFDSFGDGWNGASVNVLVNGASVGTFTIPTGSTNTGSFSANNGDNIDIVFTGGTFDSEITYNLTESGTTLFSDGPNPFIGTAFSTTCTNGDPVTYTWSPGSGLDDPSIYNPLASPASPTTYTVTIDDGVCQTTTSVTVSCVILGADCEAFQATIEGDQIHLNWMTNEEEDNKGFWIERSTDAVYFEPIAWVDSKGNAANGHSYQWIDNQNLENNQNYYYRLKQEGYDGTQSYVCDIISAFYANQQLGTLSIYPNPTKDQLTVRIFSVNNATDIELQILDVLGKNVLPTEVYTLQNGKNIIEIDLDQLAAGVYLIQVANKNVGFNRVRRVVKSE